MITVADRTALKAISASGSAYLCEEGREGAFVWKSGDYSAQVALDALEGVFVESGLVAATSGAWEREIVDGLAIEWFGAAGVSATTDTSAANGAFEVARLLETHVTDLGGRTFLINGPVAIKNGVRGFVGGGSTYRMTSTAATFKFSGRHSGEPANVSDITVRDVIVDANDQIGGSGLKVFQGENIQRGIFSDNRIINMNHGAGISLFTWADGDEPCQNCVVSNNVLLGRPGETGNGTQGRWFSIHVASQLDTPSAAIGSESSYYQTNGVAIAPSLAGRDILVTGNVISGGYYGITCIGILRSIVSNNRISKNVRGIALEWNCNYVDVEMNLIQDNLSAGILNGYACNHTKIIGNRIETVVWLGEALIKSGLKSERVLIANNKTTTQSNVETGDYHIYVGPDASFTKIMGNHLIGDCYKAYVGVESAWSSTVNDVRHFGYQKSLNNFAFATTRHVEICDNTIEALTSKDAGDAPDAIYLGAISDATRGAISLSDIMVARNHVSTNKHRKQLSALEASGAVSNCFLIDNQFERTSGLSQFDLPRGRRHFIRQQGNSFLDDQTTQIAFANADTTPSVQPGGGRLFNCANSSAVSITNFDDGIDGQVIRVRLDVNTTIVHNTSNIRLKGSTNITPQNSNSFVTFEKISGIWFETARNF